MELRKFLQEDIIAFLDKKIEQRRDRLSKMREDEINLYSVDRDYAKETQIALDQDDIKKAKKIFDELRSTYNSLDNNNEERDKIYSILEEVYVKIKRYLAKTTTTQTLAEEIAEIEQQQLPEKKEDPKTEKSMQDFSDEALREENKRMVLEEALRKAEQKIRLAINEKKIDKAAEAYRLLRKYFNEYPAADKYKKIDWYNKVLRYYNTIKNLTPVINDEKKGGQKMGGSVEHIKKIFRESLKALDKQDFDKTKSLLIDARHAIGKLGQEYDKEKNVLEHVLSRINNKIQFASTTKTVAPQHESEEKKISEEAIEAKYRDALATIRQGDKKKAIALLQEVIALSPNHLLARTRLAKLTGEQNDR